MDGINTYMPLESEIKATYKNDAKKAYIYSDTRRSTTQSEDVYKRQIETPQIRIANIIKEIEKKEDDTVKKKFAYVEEDKIILE